MCGIIGWADRSPNANARSLTGGRNALRHRGPDDGGEWRAPDGRVGLGHQRLSIVDLSSGGHQPMRSDAADLTIVFNGEIYNFKELRGELQRIGHEFRSSSDTEVVIAAYRQWGADCPARFNGMFSFALFDGPKNRLFLARDRAGEKPLFYAVDGGRLRFSSELKALLEDSSLPRRIENEALDCYLAMGFVPGDGCILQGVRKLPPAHAALFDLGTAQMKVWRYWTLPDCEVDPGQAVDEGGLESELESLLEDSVRRQMVADVPVGILLSGGVDSSLITAMAARAVPQARTFAVRFPGHARFDETEHARLIARHFGSEHTELEAVDISVDLMPRLARQFDEPIVDSSMIPTLLVSQLIRSHCKVALGGDGGDELFGGYIHYNRLMKLQPWLKRIPIGLRGMASRQAEAWLPVGLKGRNWLQGLGSDLNHGLPLIASYFDRSTRARLMGRQPRWPLVAETIREQRIPATKDLLQRATRMDFENYLAEDILVKVDRASMLNSLEIRAPLLDYRIIEFAFRKVPSHLKATATSRKILLKRLCSRILPPNFDQRRKQGFSVPLADWLKGGVWLKFFREVLLDHRDSIFDRRVVEELFDGQAKGRGNSERLFSLVLFELWRREYRACL